MHINLLSHLCSSKMESDTQYGFSFPADMARFHNEVITQFPCERLMSCQTVLATQVQSSRGTEWEVEMWDRKEGIYERKG